MPYIMKEYKKGEDTYEELTYRFEILKENNKRMIKENIEMKKENEKLKTIKEILKNDTTVTLSQWAQIDTILDKY